MCALIFSATRSVSTQPLRRPAAPVPPRSRETTAPANGSSAVITPAEWPRSKGSRRRSAVCSDSVPVPLASSRRIELAVRLEAVVDLREQLRGIQRFDLSPLCVQ